MRNDRDRGIKNVTIKRTLRGSREGAPVDVIFQATKTETKEGKSCVDLRRDSLISRTCGPWNSVDEKSGLINRDRGHCQVKPRCFAGARGPR